LIHRITLFILLALVCLLAGCSSQKAQTGAQAAGPPSMPPAPVSVAIATQESVPIQLSAVGTVEPSDTVQVKSQIAGELTAVHFTEGADIQQGAPLFDIDKRPYLEAVRQAEAALARDSAQKSLAEANEARDRAQAKSADADAARNTQLAKEGIMSQAQADQSRATADALQQSIRADHAAIDSASAAIVSDQSAIENAKLNLSYCEIHAPISGRAGNLLVHAGNLIKVSDVPLVVINRLTPIFVSFGVPQQHLPAIRANSARRKLVVQVALQNDPGKSENGVLAVIDNAVDTASGTIHLKATFDNRGRLLWPGQFVTVLLTLDTRDNATVVPSEAVQAGQRGQIVYVVKADQSVEPRPVVVGAAVGRKVVIEKGVAPGETVVTDGQLRLFPGAHVIPVPAGKVDSQTL
jgi:multidrug efflux system membrane fusion protein